MKNHGWLRLRLAMTGAVVLMMLAGLAASAIASIQLEPLHQEIIIPPGGSYAGTVRVKNVTREVKTVTVKVMDWNYDRADGTKKFVPAGDSRFSCAKWISVAPTSLQVEPGQTAEARYTLTLSTQAAGGYYSIIMFSAGAGVQTPREGVTINMAIQMGTLLLVQADGTQKLQGALTNFEAVSPQAGTPLEVRARFKNQGNVRIDAKGRLSILDEKGNAVGWTKFPDCKTLPGDEWTLTTTWAAGLAPGRYKLVGTFELAPGQVLVEEKDVIVK